MVNFHIYVPVCVLCFVGLLACGEDGHHHATDEVAEGCKHLDYGGAIPIDATTENAGALSVHARFAVALGEQDDGTYAGRVNYTSSGGHHYVLLKESARVVVTDAAGATVMPRVVQSDGMVASCASAAVLVEVVLPPAEYTFVLENAAEEVIEMTIHVAGDHHDHAH